MRDLRRSQGLTLRQLADLLEVSPATLSAVENGLTGVSSARLVRVAEVLGVPVEHLLRPPPPGGATPGTVRPGPDGSGPGRTVAGPERSRRGVLSGDLQPGGDWRDFPPLVLDTSLAAALSAFSEFGYHGATMRVIAERAGLSVPGLYHHWAGKQELLVALLDLTMDDLTARIEAARAETATTAAQGPRARFTSVVECLALFHTHRRELAFVGASEMRSLEPVARARLAGVRRAVQRTVDAEVVAGTRDGSFRTDRPLEAARAVVTMCTAMAQWFRAGGPDTAETVAQQYVDFAVGLVGGGPAAT
ncbi:hypothetical protein GCM10027596_28500 [Nocardioides korecus]